MGSVSREQIAKEIIKAACGDVKSSVGHWLLLDNLQLSLDIIPNLVRFMETMFDYEKDVKRELWDKVTREFNDSKRTRTIAIPRSLDMANRETISNLVGDDGDTDVSDYQCKRNFYETAKRDKRTETLATLALLEKARQDADDENKPYEPDRIELALKEMVFHEDLAFPVDKKFRLWYSTIPVHNFPKEFARRCKLISRELPSSIKFNTQKMLTLIKDEELDEMVVHKDDYKKLVFSITVMHSVINKRVKFGSFGWTQPYQFSPNDWVISREILKEICCQTPEKDDLPMDLIQYLIGDLNYGGKIIY